jgi:hypothetical protein
MKPRVRVSVAAALFLVMAACGPSKPAAAPEPPAAAPLAPLAPPPPVASASAPASPEPAPPATAPQAEVTTTAVTAVSSESAPPNVISPDKVIQGLRPKFNACFADGLKKDPKSAGSVTLSAKIDKDGKVSAVTPKLLTGFSPAVVKCVSDALKAASFAPAGGMNYTTSLDIPLSFTSSP